MKTLSEATKETADAKRDAHAQRLKAGAEWVMKLEAKQQPVYVPAEAWDKTDYEGVRTNTRAAIASGEAVKYDFVCDHCATELVNPEPSWMGLTSPPKRKVACPGCGWSGYTSLR